MTKLDARGLSYRELNERIRSFIDNGEKEVIVENVNGQRYIGTGIKAEAKLVVYGVPGNNLGALMDGLHIEVYGNAQDGVGNTMNAGTIVVHGHATDITGYSMRGGKIFIRGHVGYRVGIHMKAFREKNPIIVVGGRAGEFFGEYMAGGTLVLLGLDLEPGEEVVGNYVATGMHGGEIFIRGKLKDEVIIGKEAKVLEPDERDYTRLKGLIEEFAGFFHYDAEKILSVPFIKLIPYNKRPYGNLYAY